MTNRFDVLTQQLFQKNIDDCSVEELQDLANEYPYFAPAQYALLLKLKGTDHTAYQSQLQKAILYYHDPLVFDHFVNAENYGLEFSLKEEEIEVYDEEVTLYSEPEKKVEISNEAVDINNEVERENYKEAEDNIDVITSIETNEVASEQETIVNDRIEWEKVNEREVSNKEAEANNETILEKEETIINEQILPGEVTAIKEENTTAEQLAFEPYHTVDYFASQGIKLSQEEATKDKFGKQLKSFTEWLKTMKRLPAAEQAKPLDVRSEEIVENLAAQSVEKEEVYTEAMAEVWLRQGNREKAIEIYNKLSLLNPSKRAYFAAKIDSLK